ncbi:hypothetical protein [Streptomyces griseorubiginosus]|uniref:hypothetical protein n=1 Tax=Streptomyces griseorubiginosus TaxID=67304 RepID=UPI001AD7C324|nr:hypothetical protein [Streptomyces griseorubiginosus]MBO4256957.1 hypothetical protein [Streptomyces griseorubiginosus]
MCIALPAERPHGAVPPQVQTWVRSALSPWLFESEKEMESLTPASASPQPQSYGWEYQLEKDNCIHFHMVDFVAWNNRKFDMQAYYHASDVYVEMGGAATTGIDEHIAAMKDILVDNPDARILQHYPQVAQGEWTAVVGHYVPGDFRLCTFARHREGQIVEEYLFMRELTAAEPDPYADEKPFVDITSPDSTLLQVAADVRPGWNAVIRGHELGKRSATFTRREGGKVVERLRFAAV